MMFVQLRYGRNGMNKVCDESYVRQVQKVPVGSPPSLTLGIAISNKTPPIETSTIKSMYVYQAKKISNYVSEKCTITNDTYLSRSIRPSLRTSLSSGGNPESGKVTRSQ